MTVLVQIRDVDASVRDELKARAARSGVSFNSYLRDLLAVAAARPTREVVLARIQARTGGATASATELIRAERDARERPPTARASGRTAGSRRGHSGAAP
jgi:plasmid stability protein